jgi:hypothetical protein
VVLESLFTSPWPVNVTEVALVACVRLGVLTVYCVDFFFHIFVLHPPLHKQELDCALQFPVSKLIGVPFYLFVLALVVYAAKGLCVVSQSLFSDVRQRCVCILKGNKVYVITDSKLSHLNLAVAC